MSGPTDPGYFERMYAQDPDPWRFASSAYERDKYAATLAALGPRRFMHGLEVGCSIGVLSRQLAARCDAFLGLDVAEPALARARAHCADQGWARFQRAVVPDEWPEGEFDLIVFSEVLYYLGDAGIAAAAAHSRRSLRPDGLVVLVNFLGDTGAGCTGARAACAFIAAAGLREQGATRAQRYRIDVLQP